MSHAIRRFLGPLALLVVIATVSACGGKKAVLAPEWEQLKPSCMAVLPVQNESTDGEAPAVFRRLLEEKLPAKGYRVPSREFVDKILVENFDINPDEGGQIMAADPLELAKELECDGLLYATVAEWGKRTLYVYNEISVSGSYEVLSGQDGGQLWLLLEDGVKYVELNKWDDHEAAAASTAKFLLMSYEPFAVQAVDQALSKLPDRGASTADE